MALSIQTRRLPFLESKGETAMNKKTMGIVLLAGGVILLIGSLAADAIGIGGAPGFGYKQIVGAVVGVIAAVVGFVYSRK